MIVNRKANTKVSGRLRLKVAVLISSSFKKY
jgi:hypothetical protein